MPPPRVPARRAPRPPRPANGRHAALVLAGGGARGAYEAGVLRYIRRELPERARSCFEIICGTSVGAVNGCYMAATACGTPQGVPDLADLWGELELEQVFQLGLRQVVGLVRSLLSNRPPPELRAEGPLPRRLGGILDTTPLETLVLRRMPWKEIGKNFRKGALQALSVSATEIATGKTVVFVQTARGPLPPWSRDPFVEARRVRIRPVHVLASAAIPVLFPAVRVGDTYYCDGGLRQSTPLSPALRLGADRVLVIGLRADPRGEGNGRLARQRVESLTKPSFLFGKILNALLLDHIDYDLDRLRRFNAVLDAGERAFGKDYYRKLDRVVQELRGAPYRKVEEVYIKPSRDIGAIAARHVREGSAGFHVQGIVAAILRRTAAWGAPTGEADLLSYLLFDRAYTRELIDLGMSDAAARRSDLVNFLA